MSVPLWAADLAAGFWREAQEDEAFPRDLRRPIARALPLSVVLLPSLSVRAALEWLRTWGMVCEFPGQDRLLRACLVARRGHGIALINGADTDSEQRFSIAHELAHFLRDYWILRKQASRKLGTKALEVLDGKRPPTFEERLNSLLRNVSLGFHLHLMERTVTGNPTTAHIAEAENDADRLAFELLAPADHVLSGEVPRERKALVERLSQFYGLPSAQAVRYASILMPARRTDPLLLRLKAIAPSRALTEGDHG